MVAYLSAHARAEPPFADTHAKRRPVGKLGIGLAWIILADGTLTHDGGTGGFRSFAAISGETVVVVLAGSARSVNGLGMAVLEAARRSSR
jgi:hypothetical protein